MQKTGRDEAAENMAQHSDGMSRKLLLIPGLPGISRATSSLSATMCNVWGCLKDEQRNALYVLPSAENI